MKEVRLQVFYGQALVGHLIREGDEKLAFRYTPQWLASSAAFAISQSLGLTAATISHEKAGRFFANLLPEGQLRHLLARRLGLSTANDFDLLKAIGGECAGALTLLPEGATPAPAEQASYRPLSPASLAKLAGSQPLLVALSGSGGLRLSLAGAQDKLPVLLAGDKIYLPENAAPSSHILKFASRDFSHLPENELFITLLAKAVGLPVVTVTRFRFGRRSACLVLRYDRQADADNQIVRRHQEDFCQALGLSHRAKYQSEGGPSFAACFDLLNRTSTEPLPDSEQLLRWQVFNTLAGNADGHGKNLSLLYGQDGSVRLAPFYDLVCTRAYQALSRDLAMSIGESRDPGQIRGQDWILLADQIGVGQKFLLGLVRRMAKSLPTAAKSLARDFKKEFGDQAVVQMILPQITRQCRRTLQILSE